MMKYFVTFFILYIYYSYSYVKMPFKLKNKSKIIQYQADESSPRPTHRESFRKLCGDNLPEWLIDSCNKLGFYRPTTAQEISLPHIFQGKDVILQSHTGSGKTLAYSLPILSNIDPSRAAIQAVIVVPTRELRSASLCRYQAVGSEESKEDNGYDARRRQ